MECTECDGTGECGGCGAQDPYVDDCPECEGTGECTNCGGEGYIDE